jgi:hypothetical protein
MDRKAQKNKETFSGVFGISMQDASLQESMGPIQNHDEEKLLPTDRAIVMARRMLYEAAINLQEHPEALPALQPQSHHVRAAGVILPKSVDPLTWSKENLAGGLDRPLYTI